MRFYVVVEGAATERQVYLSWIPLVNPKLSYVSHPSYLQEDTFTIVSGNGYPFYKQIISNAIADILGSKDETRLVVCVDSEDMDLQEKYDEILKLITDSNGIAIDYRIVVQHFCFESWALGNRKLKGPANDRQLLDLRKHYDVSKLDPEGLPTLPSKRLNRSQLANVYLKRLLNNKHKNITYSKSSPDVVCNPKYFEQVKNRLRDTKHIKSFEAFLSAFH